jgi:ribonuclease HII
MRSKKLNESLSLKKLEWERKLWNNGSILLAGIDEAGRGPLAGPVVAAAVIFPKKTKPFNLNDSKKLTANQREILYDKILNKALAVGIGTCSEKIIDEINILQASYRAMRAAIAALPIIPQYVLVDGREIPHLNIPQTAIVKGDEKCYSIAAASIIAKVTRDRLMIAFDRKFPDYMFAQNKGYPTRKHIETLKKYGPCPIHRVSFKVKTKLF